MTRPPSQPDSRNRHPRPRPTGSVTAVSDRLDRFGEPDESPLFTDAGVRPARGDSSRTATRWHCARSRGGTALGGAFTTRWPAGSRAPYRRAPARHGGRAMVEGAAGSPAGRPGAPGDRPGVETRNGRVRGNPVEIRNCPAAVSENERRHQHWAHTAWEATVSRSADGPEPASPKTCRLYRVRRIRWPPPRGLGAAVHQC